MRIYRQAFYAILLLTCAPSVQARSPYRETIGFGYVSNTTFGRSLYVVGSHPDLGNWDPDHAVRLYYTAGNVWTGQVSVQSGTALEYKFISRDDSSALACDSNNVQWMAGANLATNVAAQPGAPYIGKTILYLSGFTNVVLVYSSAGGAFTSAPMTRLGFGRSTNEYLYRIQGIGEAGESLEFVPSDGGTNYDHAPYAGYGGGDYFTLLDVCFLQDGNIYNYWPPTNVSASRIVVTNVASSYPEIPGRRVQIYLPRGYDQNTSRRYPVLYMHDGQNDFTPGGAFGSWDADLTATKEISQGRMRECIIAAIDNTTNRLLEYDTPTDSYFGSPGLADTYGDFLINNVRPTLDFHFRTLNDPANTLTLGSSMGGVVSTYLGWVTNVFGKIGPMSPAYQTSSNFVAQLFAGPKRDMRIYTDVGTGTGGSSPCTVGDASLWDGFWTVYSAFMALGYAPNKDLLSVVGCGDQHCESAWAGRLPTAYHFLLNLGDEPNLLAQNQYPPGATNLAGAINAGVFSVGLPSLGGWTYTLERSTSLTGQAWQPVFTSTVESLPWSNIGLSDTNPLASSASAVYRIMAR